MSDGTETRTDRAIRRLKDHWLMSMLIVFGVAVGAVSQFTTSVAALREFLDPGPPAALTTEYCVLLVPLVVQLDRTKDAFER
jgi:hypothetical protein